MNPIVLSKRVFDVTYGFELEFASTFTRETICSLLNDYRIPVLVSKGGDCDYSRFWYLGTDSSIITQIHNPPAYGYELRSITFKEFPFEQVQKICELLKRKCFLTETCGLHIHYSYDTSNFINSERITLDVKKIRMPKKQRMRYCMDFTDKYRPIHFIGADYCIIHYECRVFNASFRARAIFQNWKTLDKILQKYWNRLWIDEYDLHWYKTIAS